LSSFDEGNADFSSSTPLPMATRRSAPITSGIINDSTPVGALLTLNHPTPSVPTSRRTTADYAQGGAICIPFANLDLTASKSSAAIGDAAAASTQIALRNFTNCSRAPERNLRGQCGRRDPSHFGDIALVNSTLSGNAATKGGAIYASNSDITLASSTVSANSASDSAAPSSEFGNVRASDSILAGNSQGSGSDVFGIVPTGSGNLIGAVENLKLPWRTMEGRPDQAAASRQRRDRCDRLYRRASHGSARSAATRSGKRLGHALRHRRGGGQLSLRSDIRGRFRSLTERRGLRSRASPAVRSMPCALPASGNV
jgi:hypothetical protein